MNPVGQVHPKLFWVKVCLDTRVSDSVTCISVSEVHLFRAMCLMLFVYAHTEILANPMLNDAHPYVRTLSEMGPSITECGEILGHAGLCRVRTRVAYLNCTHGQATSNNILSWEVFLRININTHCSSVTNLNMHCSS